MSENQSYIDLKINGRLFPLWIMHNMKNYKLPAFNSPEGYASDTQITNKEDTVMTLMKYQAFIGSILTYKSKQKNALIYHGLGAGKTGTAINVYNVLYNYNPMWNVFIIIKSGLHDDPWLKDLKNFLPKNEFDERFANIKFVHYDAPNADKLFLTAVKESDATKQNIYIFDEAHNFIKNVYSNITNQNGRRALTIYDYIMKEKKVNDNTRVLLLTGTPAVNEPYELAILFNLLRPDSFPDTESKFKEIYISKDDNNNEILNPKNKNMFQRRILGLVSYYIGSDPQLFASKTMHIKTIEMSAYQSDTYSHYEYVEEQMERQSKSSTVYKTYTRQSSNFVFPHMGDYNGENRPRPSHYKLSEKQAREIIEGNVGKLLKSKKDMDIASIQKNVDIYLGVVKSYITALEKYFKNINDEDIKNKNTLQDDIKVFKEKYNMKFKTFWKKYDNKSNLLIALHTCSCKYVASLFYSMRSIGPLYFFSNFVKMEGLEVLKIYMSYFGYKNYRDKSSVDNFRYTEFHGDIKREDRRENMANHNNINNLHGEKIKVVLVSPAGAEGINLKYMRQVHILDPYWHDVRIRQLIGRGLRMDSHGDLPKEERHLDIFRYHAVKKNTIKLSTDEKIYNLAEAKQKRIDTFLTSVKEAAIDCELFKNHNMNEQSYTCFKFNESSYFNKLVGPAYKQDLFYDKKINDGLNAINSTISKIKVYKIKAKILKNEEEFGETNDYWYNPKTGIVYNIEFDYPIGTVQKVNGIPSKIETVYIIDETINIPTLKRSS
jgi:superfamily II DNA or RNA helicase